MDPDTRLTDANPQALFRPALAVDDTVRFESHAASLRWGAVGLGIVHALAFAGMDGVDLFLLLPYGALAVGNALVLWRVRHVGTPAHAMCLAASSTLLDYAIIAVVVGLWAGDELMTPWPLLVMVPFLGAARFQLFGSLAGWVGAVGIYVGVASIRAEIPLEAAFAPATLVFRLGLLLLVAVLVGLVTADQMRQRRRAESAAERLHAAEQWRTRIVSTLGHDVRGPLASLVQAAELLRDRGTMLDEDTRCQMVGAIARQGSRVQQLANDLLDLARLDVGTFELQLTDCDMPELLERAVSYLAETHDITIIAPHGLHAQLDPARMEQVVVNLVGNGLRHGAPPVIVEARAEQQDLLVTVTDHGSGVLPEQVTELFEPFAAGTHPDSVGLGLWIVHALTAAHGGTVHYERAKGAGARFVVRIPGAVTGPQPERRPAGADTQSAAVA